ncbi:MAG: hypothetical protein IPN17_11270 [Deltaproteobacteria bacterium]|jgi:hypothetical protein|nr:hypothetical protein [Deltaproteobacteria bacterium]MBK7070225.1 hypothetical protein [Deltaproteobacteria bacterium]MBK8692845.1 hypothetical protein [Deltaproteobacteria bacterium]MBP6832039.1 hypothetical protein [Deltaproteobacteria bacterium]
MHTVVPRSGVRYELTLVEGAESEARYDAVVFTHELTGRARVCIRRDGASLEGPAEDIGEAHLAQLLALAKALGKREGAPWPRRINRWRSPGVR